MISFFSISRLALALALAAIPVAAVAAPDSGTALVIGVGPEGGCRQAANDVAARLGGQGITTKVLIDPNTIGFRSALDDFAASLEGTTPSVAMIYVCAPTVEVDAKLFALPSDANTGSASSQGIVLQALLNALAGTGGTVFADLGMAAAASADAVHAIERRLPAGLHLALGFSSAAGKVVIGHELANPSFQANQGWPTIAPALASAHEFGRVIVMPAPAIPSALPTPAAPAPTVAEAAPKPPAEQPTLPNAPPGSSEPPVSAGVASVPPLRQDAPTLPDSHTSPNVPPSHTEPGKPQTAALPKPVPDRTPPHGTPHVTRDSRIERLQQALARKGYYAGPINGHVDLSTQIAIRGFQRTLRTPETGVLTQPEIIRLLND